MSSTLALPPAGLPADPAPRRTPAGGLAAASVVLLAVAIVAFVAAMPTFSATVGLLGLLAASPALLVAVIAAPLAAGLAIAARAPRAAAVALVVTVLVNRLPFSLAESVPAYAWTYKHLGVVDLIGSRGAVVPGVDIYQSWPGMFAAFAWLHAVTGVETIEIARWFPVVVQLAFTAGVYALARSWRVGRRRLSPTTAIAAALVAQLANWVGQDYFSPQAVAIALATVVLALLLAARDHPSLVWLALALFTAITVMHQLTPFWLAAVAVALAVLRLVKPWWAAALFVAVAGGWLLLHIDATAVFGPLVSLDAAQNATTATLGTGSVGQTVAAIGGRTASALLWVGAAACVVVALVARRSAWRGTLALAAVAFAPFGLLLGQGYGGEAIFRVMLYSIPGCAVLVAPTLASLLQRGVAPGGAHRATAGLRTRGPRLVGALALLGLLAVASGQAAFGAWSAYTVTPASAQAVADLLESAPTGARIISVGPGAAGRSVARYADFVAVDREYDAAMTLWDGWQGEGFEDPAREHRLTGDLRWLDRPAYIVITSEMKRWSAFYGVYPDGAIDRFEQQLRADWKWQVVVDDPDVLIVRLTGVSNG